MSERLLRLPGVKELVGLETSAIYEKIRNGTFPKPIKQGRLSMWLYSEVQKWIQEQIRASRSDEKASSQAIAV